MLDSVIVARDRFLRPGGLVAPSQCSIILAAVQDEVVYNDTVSYWNDVYGKHGVIADRAIPEGNLTFHSGIQASRCQPC